MSHVMSYVIMLGMVDFMLGMPSKYFNPRLWNVKLTALK